MRTPEEVVEANLAFTAFSALFVLGFVGSVLSTGPTEPYYKVALFIAMGLGSFGTFFGLNAFHTRRVEDTGDPRTTVYSAIAIYSSLAMTVVCVCLVVVIMGRFAGIVSEDTATHISYYFITIVALVYLAGGALCVSEARKGGGLLAKRIYLWPWSRAWAKNARRRRFRRRYDGDDS